MDFRPAAALCRNLSGGVGGLLLLRLARRLQRAARHRQRESQFRRFDRQPLRPSGRMDGRDARRPFVRFVRDRRPDHRDDDGRAHPAPAARPFPPLGAQLAAGADPGVADARRRLRRRVGNVQQRLGRRLRHRNGTPAERKHRYGGVLHRVAGRLDSDGRLHQPQFHQYGQPRRQRARRQERQAGGNGGAEGAVVAVARRLPSPGRG